MAEGRKGVALRSKSAPFRLPAPSPAAQGKDSMRNAIAGRKVGVTSVAITPSLSLPRLRGEGGRRPEGGRRCIRRAPPSACRHLPPAALGKNSVTGSALARWSGVCAGGGLQSRCAPFGLRATFHETHDGPGRSHGLHSGRFGECGDAPRWLAVEGNRTRANAAAKVRDGAARGSRSRTFAMHSIARAASPFLQYAATPADRTRFVRFASPRQGVEPAAPIEGGAQPLCARKSAKLKAA